MQIGEIKAKILLLSFNQAFYFSLTSEGNVFIKNQHCQVTVTVFFVVIWMWNCLGDTDVNVICFSCCWQVVFTQSYCSSIKKYSKFSFFKLLKTYKLLRMQWAALNEKKVTKNVNLKIKSTANLSARDVWRWLNRRIWKWFHRVNCDIRAEPSTAIWCHTTRLIINYRLWVIFNFSYPPREKETMKNCHWTWIFIYLSPLELRQRLDCGWWLKIHSLCPVIQALTLDLIPHSAVKWKYHRCSKPMDLSLAVDYHNFSGLFEFCRVQFLDFFGIRWKATHILGTRHKIPLFLRDLCKIHLAK